MMMIDFMIPFILFFMGVYVFISKRKHLLITLMSLEFIVLSLFMYMYMYLSIMNYEIFFTMIFLTFSVCEGALGLSILVSMVRTHGNDYFSSFSILQC
uniref:NADH dehydrogenase subunit 4L n=1 Tax=Megaxyela euchroma TaxID=1874363 RepID=UPI00220C608D|nr:NADH dehydrogenase subunit 4L [Megaxyela euchroma]UXP85892.1 NADH dehydrogenase subunit 4L [Megaxyela euchroma]